MRVNNNQNNLSFQARIGKIDTKNILKYCGKETLDEIELLLPKIIGDEERFGDKTFIYSFGLNGCDDLLVACEKLFKKNYPETKTKLGKIFTNIKKFYTAGYEQHRSFRFDGDTVEEMTIRAKNSLLKTELAKSYETFNKNQSEKAKAKAAEQAFNTKLEKLKKNY